MAKENSFLTAEWRNLIIANYEINPQILLPYLPHKTVLDLFNGSCIVSLVGFMFVNTKLKGIKIPFHVNFEEVNLRFYVKHFENGKWKRGVVFIKEIVPKHALTLVANVIYKEHYHTMPMKHTIQKNPQNQEIGYFWKVKDKWQHLKITANLDPQQIEENSEEVFITEHYWGYTKLNNEVTSEYEVKHPKWLMYQPINFEINVDFGNVYGSDFAMLTMQKPKSVFLAEGSNISVQKGKTL